ncbi:MAG: AAA family ATPase [Gemmataceae bacterium]
MPQHTFHLTALLQRFDNELILGQALYHPEFDALDSTADRVVQQLKRDLVRLLEALDPAVFSTRRGPSEVVGDVLRLELTPTDGGRAWRDPLVLPLPVVRWQHGDAYLALLPTLGVEVVAASEQEREEMLPRHARIALMRVQAMRLDQLGQLARVTGLEIQHADVQVERKTPRQAVQAERDQREAKKSVLEEVGTRLDGLALRPAFEMDEPLRLLAETLGGRHPRSVLLIGPSGVGKTALLHELVRQREALGLAGRPFWATSGARLVAGQSGFGMWQKRCQDVLREASRTRAILHLGSLVELLEVGKSEGQSQGLATFLRPSLARGELLGVLECTADELPFIERQDPHLVRALMPLRLTEPDLARVERILRQVAGNPTPLEPAGLTEILRLHARYAAYSANPGRPLRFLRNLLADVPEERRVGRAEVTEAFARETGLPLVLLEDSIRLDLEATRTWFASRVIGQDEAVSLVVDLLATVKAALNRPRKPIASLLFIGPTGVGKTEMAKALAEFLFGSRDRLTRFDMSEYADAQAVQRLIGGAGASEGLLTARVREQPFSVVLLDEVEKAHPQLFDLLLQVLGEGRLTDTLGRLADFSNSVVILTSNLGAESYLQGDFGLLPGQATAARAREHFTREVEGALRPELVNRIDRVVPFVPLEADITRRIAARQIQLLRQRDGIHFRGVTLEVSEALVDWLTQKGHDPRYGARPLKRTIERYLLAPLAEQMNGYLTDTALRVTLGVEHDAPQIHVRARTDEAGQAVAAGGAGADEVWSAEQAVGLRRLWQQLNRCSAMTEVINEVYLAEQARKKVGFFNAQQATLVRLRDEAAAGLAEAIEREDRLLVQLHRQRGLEVGADEITREMQANQARFHQTLLSLYLQRFEKSSLVTLAVFSEEPDLLQELTAAYHAVARAGSYQVQVWQIVVGTATSEGPRRRLLEHGEEAFGQAEEVRVRVWVKPRKAFEREIAEVPRVKGVVGWALVITGPAALPRFGAEEGLHVFQTARRTSRALVVTGAAGGAELELPEGIDRKGAIGNQTRRRVYRPDQSAVDDGRLGWQPQSDFELPRVLGRCIEATLQGVTAEVLEQ